MKCIINKGKRNEFQPLWEDRRDGNQRKSIRKLSLPLALISFGTRRALLQLLENDW